MITIPVEDLRLMMEVGYLYAAMRRFQESREVFEAVCILAPESEVPIVALGNTFFSELKFAEAIKHYEKALKLVPESAFAQAYLGESLMFLNKKEDAKKVLEIASRLDPKGKSGDFARSLLELIQKGFDPSKVHEKAAEIHKTAK